MSGGTLTLSPTFDFATDTTTISINDNDTGFDGDTDSNEAGNDGDQFLDGTSDRVYAEERYILSNGTEVTRVEVNGTLTGYIISGTSLTPGVSYTVTSLQNVAGEDDDDDDDDEQPDLYTSFNDVACFTAGTMVLTPTGPCPVEVLRVGDKVVTRDDGVQPVEWIASQRLGPAELVAEPNLRPIAFEARWTGHTQRTLLSPQHGVLVHSKEWGPPRLVRAIQMARLPGGAIRVAQGVRQVTYVHFLLPRHSIVFANGIAAETFFPGCRSLGALTPVARLSLLAMFPDCDLRNPAAHYGPPAHPFAKTRELPNNMAELRPEHRTNTQTGDASRLVVRSAGRLVTP